MQYINDRFLRKYIIVSKGYRLYAGDSFLCYTSSHTFTVERIEEYFMEISWVVEGEKYSDQQLIDNIEDLDMLRINGEVVKWYIYVTYDVGKTSYIPKKELLELDSNLAEIL